MIQYYLGLGHAFTSYIHTCITQCSRAAAVDYRLWLINNGLLVIVILSPESSLFFLIPFIVSGLLDSCMYLNVVLGCCGDSKAVVAWRF